MPVNKRATTDRCLQPGHNLCVDSLFYSPSEVGVAFFIWVPICFSQVNLSFRGVGRWGCGWELRGNTQGHLLYRAVLIGILAAAGIGTARGWKARPVFLTTQPGAAVGQASQTPSLLVRHECGELGGIPGLTHRGGMAWHPAGIWVTQFTALSCAVSGHRHIRERADICGQVRGHKSQKSLLCKTYQESWKKMAFMNRDGFFLYTLWNP